MRKIGTLDNFETAQWFRYYLDKHHGILCKDPDLEDTHDCDIWILSDDDVAKGKTCLELFVSCPDKQEYKISQGALRQTKELMKKVQVSAVKYTGVRHQEATKETFFSKWSTWSKTYPWTHGVSVLCVALFILSLFDRAHVLRQTLWISMLSPQKSAALGFHLNPWFFEIREGQWWRLLSPVFLHGDILHIAFNVMWFIQLGSWVESKYRGWLLMGLITCTGILSNIVFYLVAGPAFEGLSGVIYGLIGFMWVKCHIEPHRCGNALDPGLIRFFIIWYVICWLLSAVGLHIANSIHGSGAMAGVLFGFFHGITKHRWRNLKFDKEFIYHVLIALALLVGGIVADKVSY